MRDVRNSIKRCMTLLSAVLLLMSASAQDPEFRTEEPKPPALQRFYFGGSFGLQFGTVTNIEISPMVGFWLLPRVAVAAGPSFQYLKAPGIGTTIFGGRTYLQFALVKDLSNLIPVGAGTGIFVQGEYELLSVEKRYVTLVYEDEGRVSSGNFLAGAGISQRTGRRSSLNITFLWCVSNDQYELYSNPVIRFEMYF
jgi:hypothetical protein